MRPHAVMVLMSTVLSVCQSKICSELEGSNNEEYWQIIKLSEFDRIFLLSAGGLSVILLALTLATWTVYKSFSTPSDIMLAICLSEFIENVALFTQATYFTVYSSYDGPPPEFEGQCYGMGILIILGNVTSIYYNLVFCVVLSYSIRNTLSGAFFDRKKYHIISIVVTLTVVLVLSLTQSLGRGLNGLCGFRVASRQSTARFILQIIIALICIYSMAKFQSKLPANDYFKKQAVFGYYYYYMGVFATIQIISSASYLTSDIICHTTDEDINTILHIFYSISICSSIFLSYGIVCLRLSHPILLAKILKTVGKKSTLTAEERQMLEFELPESQQTDEETSSWLGCLLESLKGSQILSFIEGLTIANIEKQSKYSDASPTALSYSRNYIYEVNDEIVEKYIQRRISSRETLIVKQKLGGLSCLPYEVISYCPEVFNAFSERSEIRQVIRSLNIKKNINIVKKESYTNGGKSGQFFFCTYDHLYILKTIKEDEAHLLLDRMKEFYLYFRKERDSLIVKIIGLYRFKRKDINEEPIYIILMRNLTQCSKEHNIRVYDIKGSEFNRSAIEDKGLKQDKGDDLRKHTLKDKDFKILEEKIRLEMTFSRKLKNTIRKDIEFLGSLGLMDYSLLIVKRKGPRTENSLYRESISSEDDQVIYNFGIIDYLESWNLKRRAERAFKTLITNEEVTANSPMNYSSRLSNFIDTIL